MISIPVFDHRPQWLYPVPSPLVPVGLVSALGKEYNFTNQNGTINPVCFQKCRSDGLLHFHYVLGCRIIGPQNIFNELLYETVEYESPLQAAFAGR